MCKRETNQDREEHRMDLIATPPTRRKGAKITPHQYHSQEQSDQHDAETFRVAEELMLLSASKSIRKSKQTNNEGKDHAIRQQEPTHKKRKWQKALGEQFELLKSPICEVSNERHHRVDENMINSLSNVSHSELLNEHCLRFRRVRRRWNMERANKQKIYLSQFTVQGIPLVQHLASLSHW